MDLAPSSWERSGNSRWNSLNLRFPNVCCVAPGLNVGYVTGSGDEVPQALENLGLKVPFLSSADLASGNLARFHAILLGVRAYAAREDLKARLRLLPAAPGTSTRRVSHYLEPGQPGETARAVTRREARGLGFVPWKFQHGQAHLSGFPP